MRLNVHVSILLLYVFSISKSYAIPNVYQPRGTGIRFLLPYSTGTHEGRIKKIMGVVTLDQENLKKIQGIIRVPIDEISTGNLKRDCHMLEALGLDYTKSDYPKDHVCNDKNQLPSTGKNAIVYPNIQFKIISARQDRGEIEIEGEWTIHGVTKVKKTKFELLSEGVRYRVRGQETFSLKEFGVEVKPAHIIFVKISVHDQVKVIFNLLLSPIKQKK